MDLNKNVRGFGVFIVFAIFLSSFFILQTSAYNGEKLLILEEIQIAKENGKTAIDSAWFQENYFSSASSALYSA